MEFDGKSSWEDYETHLRMVSKANEWSDMQSAIFLSASLRDSALSYVGALKSESLMNYSLLTTALRKRFGAAMQSANAYAIFQTRYQKNGEKFVEFANDVQRLARLVYPSLKREVRDSLCIQQFLDGISDSEVQCRVRCKVLP